MCGVTVVLRNKPIAGGRFFSDDGTRWDLGASIPRSARWVLGGVARRGTLPRATRALDVDANMSSPRAAAPDETRSRASRGATSEERLEFGGPAGALAIMLASHVAVYYLHLCVDAAGGDLYPLSLTPAGLRATWADLRAHATPTIASWCAYLGFLAHQAILALACPGPVVLGYPCSVPPRRARGVENDDHTKDADGNAKDADDKKDAVPKVRLAYTCNALAAWWCTLGTVAVAVAAFGDAPLVWVANRRGELLTCAVLTADLASLAAYAHATLTGAAERVTGHPAYDLFMGAARNPRAFGGKLDWKMWTELRVSWVTLFLLTLASAAKARRRFGAVDPSSAVLLLAHWLYANACQKGEESVPFTWDVFHEKWGWMLIFWNLAGVPFAYSVNAAFVASRGPGLKPAAARLLALFLLAAYYVWDTAQSQRTRFRAQRQGTYVNRPWAFPRLPWGTLEAPRAMETKNGAPLLVSGWVGLARKIHYTADAAMATCWAAACGYAPWTCLVPWAYPIFFAAMIAHRTRRDDRRCREKYGDDWDEYERRVPDVWIPGLL